MRAAIGMSAPARVAGEALAVPHLVGRPDRVEDRFGELQLGPEAARESGVPGDHPVDLLAARDREVERDPHPMCARTTGPEQPEHRRNVTRAERLVLVLGCLHRDVVAKPPRLLVRVGVTPDVDQQRRVVHREPLGLVEIHEIRKTERDSALAEDVLHRLGEAEIDPERQRREQLGQPHRWVVDVPAHAREARPARPKNQVYAR